MERGVEKTERWWLGCKGVVDRMSGGGRQGVVGSNGDDDQNSLTGGRKGRSNCNWVVVGWG